MIGPEKGAEAHATIQLLAKHLSALGWTLKGRSDDNVGVQHPDDPSKTVSIGLDGLFELPSGFTRGQRGVLIDAKRESWTTAGPNHLAKNLALVSRRAVQIQDSRKMVIEQRNMDPTFHCDVAIVAWDCHIGWRSEEEARRLGQLCPPGHTRPLLRLIWTPTVLDRIVSLSGLVQPLNDVEYFCKADASRSANQYTNACEPEMISSPVVIFRHRKNEEASWRVCTAYWGGCDDDHVLFLLNLLSSERLLNDPHVVYFFGPMAQATAMTESLERILERSRWNDLAVSIQHRATTHFRT